MAKTMNQQEACERLGISARAFRTRNIACVGTCPETRRKLYLTTDINTLAKEEERARRATKKLSSVRPARLPRSEGGESTCSPRNTAMSGN